MESPKKTWPITAAKAIEEAMITRPSRDIQMREEACLIASGLPDEPMYWIAEVSKLIKVQAAAAKTANLKILLRSKRSPRLSAEPALYSSMPGGGATSPKVKLKAINLKKLVDKLSRFS